MLKLEIEVLFAFIILNPKGIKFTAQTKTYDIVTSAFLLVAMLFGLSVEASYVPS